MDPYSYSDPFSSFFGSVSFVVAVVVFALYFFYLDDKIEARDDKFAELSEESKQSAWAEKPGYSWFDGGFF